jgi:DNA integrity scanning protein DisA with diadenylate cyclase activity
VSRADRVAAAIEVLRVAALSSYENRAISTGLLILGPEGDQRALARPAPAVPLEYSQWLTGVKSFFRLVDGLRTLFLVTHESRLLDIVDVRQWAADRCGADPLPAPVPSTYEAHARATLRGGHVCVVLSPSHEIKVFAEGAEILTFRHAHWHLLDVQAKFELWAEAVGQRSLATRLFQTALELSNARQGALFVVLREPGAAIAHLVSTADRVDAGSSHEPRRQTALPTRRDLLDLLTGRAITDLEPSVLAALASLDGATVTDPSGALIAAGAILRSASPDAQDEAVIVEGARTTAALAASRYGPVLKVSEDGAMTFYDGARIWDL